MSADRHLLYGLLALQNGLIDQVQLVATFQAWTRDKTRSLADHLVAMAYITPAQRSVIDALAALHVEVHGGAVEQSLAAVPAGSSTRESLAHLKDPDIERTLHHVAGSHSASVDGQADRTVTYAVGTVSSGTQRFRVLRPHARGGLGSVSVALDSELNREVALKQILDQIADDPMSRERFLLEAEVTGALEHPGIVPVYALGTDERGHPFYAMRFVRGDSLREAIERFHTTARARNDRGSHALELRQLLRRYLDVCNAIEFAHSRGVLHRDIKPGNIILGKHGETLVIDWGLAKPMGRREPRSDHHEFTLRPFASSRSADTQMGSALGTPAYMSPEQARGDLDEMGPPTDVYSLGATLYFLMTGKPPFEGNDAGEVLRKVQRGEFAAPRRLNKSIPRALEAITLKAMALRPADRYPSARDLADDVDRWLADARVTAYREEDLLDKFSRWMRRNRAGTLAAAFVLITIAASAIGALLWTEAARREAVFQRGLAATAQGRAIDNLRIAQDLNRWAFNDLAASTLAEIPGGEPLRRSLAQTAANVNSRILVVDPSNRAVRWDESVVNKTLGHMFRLANEPVSAARRFDRALEFARGLVKELPLERQTTSKEYCHILARVCLDAAAMYRERGRHADALLLLDEALGPGGVGRWLQMLEPLRTPNMKYPINIVSPYKTEGRLKLEQAQIHLEEGRYAEALARLDSLAEFFRKVVDQLDPKAAAEHLAEYPGSEFKEDVRSLAEALCGRAHALEGLGRGREAEEPFAEAIRRLEPFEHSDLRLALAESLTRRGLARAADPKRRKGAAADFERSLAVNQRLMGDLGETVSRLRLKAITLLGRGTLRVAEGKPHHAAAATDLAAARELLESLVSKSEGKPAVRDLVDLAEAESGLAALARERDARDEARKLLEDASARVKEALAVCPEHAAGRRVQDRLAGWSKTGN